MTINLDGDRRPDAPRTLSATWFVHRKADGSVHLQIELGEDYAVLLSCSAKDGPVVTIHFGIGERIFAEGEETPYVGGYATSRDVFSQWLDEVVMNQKTAA